MFIPPKLAQYIATQEQTEYTNEDLFVWKKFVSNQYVLLKTQSNYIETAYISGFYELGLSPDYIPNLVEINQVLQTAGWSAVYVNGYIPAKAYAHFISLKIFPISKSIRKIYQIDHAPMPDFIHDIMGHLPLLLTNQYQEFLQQITYLMTHNQGNKLDEALFQANLELANLKNVAHPNKILVQNQLEKIKRINHELKTNPSVVSFLNRMFLWSIEFGLIGTTKEYRCFGAGILSSPTELNYVCQRKPKILPYSLKVIDYDIDFINFQSNYFVATDFDQHINVLKQFHAFSQSKEKILCV